MTVIKQYNAGTAAWETIVVGKQGPTGATGPSGTPTGSVQAYAGLSAPSGWLLCFGQTVSRTTYVDLYNIVVPSQGTVTITIASPAVVSQTSHPFTTGDAVFLTTTGALPTGLSANTLYYVISVNANSYNLATSRANALAGTKINTSGSQSGTHTLFACPYGLGDGSTTFTIPDLRGRAIAGLDRMGGTSANLLTNQTGGLDGDILGNTGGSETHTLTTSQIPAAEVRVDDGSGTLYPLFGATGGTLGGYLGRPATEFPNATNTGRRPATINGGGGAHNNVQPTVTLNYIIKT